MGFSPWGTINRTAAMHSPISCHTSDQDLVARKAQAKFGCLPRGALSMAGSGFDLAANTAKLTT